MHLAREGWSDGRSPAPATCRLHALHGRGGSATRLTIKRVARQTEAWNKDARVIYHHSPPPPHSFLSSSLTVIKTTRKNEVLRKVATCGSRTTVSQRAFATRHVCASERLSVTVPARRSLLVPVREHTSEGAEERWGGGEREVDSFL